MIATDTRPWWKKLTNVGIALVGVAGTLAPYFLAAGQLKAAAVCTGVVAAGAALGVNGAARRADALRDELIAAQRGDTGGSYSRIEADTEELN